MAATEKVARGLLRLLPGFSLRTKVDLDLFTRPAYAYGLYHGAKQAAALGYKGMTAIEFGVAGGNGLVELENLAVLVEKELGVRILTLGFDMGSGLPAPEDYRDLPYAWRRGFYEMDEAALRARLKRSRLFLGDVAETVRGLGAHIEGCPIGFIAFDMDYYSSTKVALNAVGALSDSNLLPRTYCFFDDIVSDDEHIFCEHVGELLVIGEFNKSNEAQKVSKIHLLQRVLRAVWNEQMYVLHRFNHSQYCSFARKAENEQIPLR